MVKLQANAVQTVMNSHPVVLTAVESKEFSGNITPQLLDLFPGLRRIGRSSMNAWDDRGFSAAVQKTRRKNLIIAALWSEVCLAMHALQALTYGYGGLCGFGCLRQRAHPRA